jgi:hypothetical protein
MSGNLKLCRGAGHAADGQSRELERPVARKVCPGRCLYARRLMAPPLPASFMSPSPSLSLFRRRRQQQQEQQHGVRAGQALASMGWAGGRRGCWTTCPARGVPRHRAQERRRLRQDREGTYGFLGSSSSSSTATNSLTRVRDRECRWVRVRTATCTSAGRGGSWR